MNSDRPGGLSQDTEGGPRLGQRMIVLAVGGRIARADIPALCERVRKALEVGDVDQATCDVGAIANPDAVVVDALARLQLTAWRRGCSIRFRHASRELQELLAVMGLGDIVATGADRDTSRSQADNL